MRLRTLRLRTAVVAAVASIGHELIELRFILGKAQSVEEVAEFALLFFEALERLGAIVVERPVTA